MNIALLVNAGILKPLQSLMRWWVTGWPHSVQAAASTHEVPDCAPELVATTPLMTRATRHSVTLHKPLRVVRVVEAGQARTSVGRMVISGRMADVCAELDRLAAREAAPS